MAGEVLLSRLLTQVVVSLGDSSSQLRQHKSQLEETHQSGQQFARSHAQIGEASVQLRTRLLEMQNQMAGLRSVERDLEAQSAQLGGSLGAQLGSQAGQTREQMARLQIEMQGVRGQLREVERGTESGAIGFGKYFTALIAVREGIQIIEGQVRAYGEFNQALVRTEALTSTTHAQIVEMTPAIRALSVETGRSTKELGEALYSIESSGARGAEGLDILNLSAKGATVGMGTATDIARLLTQTTAVYGMTSKDAAGLMDVLTVAVRDGASEASDYARNIGQVLPVAQALGISFPQVAASLSVMSIAEQNTARNATALKNVMQELLGPSEQSKQALAGIGLTADQVRQMLGERGLASTLLLLRDRTQGNIDVLEKIFPDMRGFQGLLRLTGEQADKYQEILANAANATGTFDQAFVVTGQSVVTQAERMARGFDNLGQTLVERIAPFVVPIANEIANRLTPSVSNSGDKADEAAKKWERYGSAVKVTLDVLGGAANALGAGIDATLGRDIDLLGENIQQYDALKKAYDDYQRGRELAAAQNRRAMGTGEEGPILGEREVYTREGEQEQQRLALAAAAASRRVQAEQSSTDQIVQAVTEGGDRVHAAYEAALSFDREQLILGDNGAKLLKALDDFVKKPFEEGGQQALESAAVLQAKIQEAWRVGLDPSVAGPQIQRLQGLFSQFTEGMGEEAKAAITAQIRIALLAFGESAEDDKINQRQQQRVRAQQAEERRIQADAEREAKAARDRLINGLVADIESRRPGIVELYGRVGDQAISSFVQALSGARSGQSAEPIIQAQAKLAEQLRAAGVVNYQEAAERAGQAYLEALAGRISGSQAAQILQESLSEIPRLSPETFIRGLDRQAMLSLGGGAGRQLAEGIEQGFKEGGQKAITEVQRAAISLLRETEKINDPDLAYQRSSELMTAIARAVAEGTPEAIGALEAFGAQWRRQIDLDIAQQQYTEKVREGAQENVRSILQAQAEASRQVDELVRGVGEERGSQGLERFRQNMRDALGEQTDLFRNVSEQIDQEQAKIGGTGGFRQARDEFQRLMDDRIQRFREEQYQEQTIFQESEDAKRREIAHTRQDEDNARRRGREDAQIGLSSTREAQDVARRRNREDAEANRQLNEQLARATTPEQQAQIRSQAGEATGDRTRQRRFEDEDRQISRARAQEDLAIRRGQETADQQLTRGREQQDLEIQRGARERQHAFETKQAQDLRDEQLKIAMEVRNFEDLQADQRHGHQLRNIEAEKNKRIEEANNTFAELLKKEQEHLANVEEQATRPAWRRALGIADVEFFTPAEARMASLMSGAGNGGAGAGGGEQDEALLSFWKARQNSASLSASAPQQTNEPMPVVLPDQQIQDIVDGVGNLPPMEMDEEVVESKTSRIRRNKQLSRTVG